jgi:ribose 5-phosphate isomerase A
VDDATRLTRLAIEAAAIVENGMTLGLGSGSTAEAVIRALGARVAAGLRVTGVATSARTERVAKEVGIPLVPFDDVTGLDLGIDGADEIDPRVDVVKGRGGALLYEKLIALACDRYLIVAASEKLVPQLGTKMPLPIEIIPFGWKQTLVRLNAAGYQATLRCADDSAPFVSDGGHYILDTITGPIGDAHQLADTLKGISGVVEHGLFAGFADLAMVVDPDGHVRTIER